MRLFGTNRRAKIEKSPFTDILLPLPSGFGAPPPPTPVGFGVPLACPRFKPLKETWIVAYAIKVELHISSKLKKYVPRAVFPSAEVARIKAYMKKAGKGPRTPLIPLLGGSLTPATTGSPLLNSPFLSQAALTGGTTSRPWNQIVREGVDKAATEEATAETQRRNEGATKKNGHVIWDLTQVQPPDDHSEFPEDLVIRYPKELDDQPWNDSDDWYSSPPPPIPLLVAIEMEAKVAQSNEDAKL